MTEKPSIRNVRNIFFNGVKSGELGGFLHILFIPFPPIYKYVFFLEHKSLRKWVCEISNYLYKNIKFI